MTIEFKLLELKKSLFFHKSWAENKNMVLLLSWHEPMYKKEKNVSVDLLFITQILMFKRFKQ